jgi:small subunit ribosomal protein S6
LALRPYELFLLIDPNLGDEKIAEMIVKVEDKIKGWGGEIIKTDKWGLKKLASLVKKAKKLTQAYYTIIYFQSESTLPEKLRGYLKVTEHLVRYSVINSEATPQPAATAVAAAEAVFVGEIQGEGLGQP